MQKLPMLGVRVATVGSPLSRAPSPEKIGAVTTL